MSDNAGYADPRINERVASLEAANEFNKESLQEISATLKEVVKTQSMLANQRDEILKIAESVRKLSNLVHDHDKDIANLTYRLHQAEIEAKQTSELLQQTRDESRANTRILRIAVGVISTAMVPLGIAVFKGMMGW